MFHGMVCRSRESGGVSGNCLFFHLRERLEFLWDGTVGSFELLDHTLSDPANGVDLSLTWDEVFFLRVDETDDLVIPGGFFELFDDFHVFARDVIVDRDRDKILLDHLNERFMGEDFGPKDLAAVSSRNFLEKEEDRLLLSGGLFK